MKLKKKLSLGLGFLFVIIFALAFFCAYYVEKLADTANTILKDNYDSIVYSKNMFDSLDTMKTAVSSGIFIQGDSKKLTDYYAQMFESGKVTFEKNINAEKNNITEIHEQEYVNTLSSNYVIFLNLRDLAKQGAGSSAMYFNEMLPCYEKLKHTIISINDLNMQAIERKSQITKQQASNVIIYMSVIAVLCVILAFGYFWYFPLYISTVIADIADKITVLLKKKGVTSEVKTDDEMYAILQSLMLLEEKLGVEDTPNKT
jgi:two-component system, NtrC family, sensor histidine kinase KinB